MATECTVTFCPLNMRAFEQLKEKTGDIELAAFCSKILFHLQNSKISRVGEKCITRSREQFASWFQFSKRKTDNFINKLSRLDLVKKCLGSWYGNKSVFLYQGTEEFNCCPLNITAITQLINLTGSLKSALVLSFILYRLTNTKITHENKKWCALKVDDIAQWALISRKSAGLIINSLVELGLIEKKFFNWKGRAISHFALTSKIKALWISKEKNLDKIGNSLKDASSWVNPATPIKISQKEKITNNKKALPLNFNEIKKYLSPNQEKYLKRALENTVTQNHIIVSNSTTLFEELKFSLTCLKTSTQIGFKGKVAKYMQLLIKKRWRTPFGFIKFSSYGKELLKKEKEKNKKKEVLVKERSETKRKSTLRSTQDIFCEFRAFENTPSASKAQATKDALTYIERFSTISTEAQQTALQSTLMPTLEAFINKGANPLSIKIKLRGLIN